MSVFMFYPNPLSARCTLKTDDGFTGTGMHAVSGGREGQAISVITGHPSGHGAEFTVEANGYETLRVRGFLVIEEEIARLQVDDYTLTEVGIPPVPGPEPPTGEEGPDPNANPLDIINYVYNSTLPNLASHTGCGLFTEDCCEALHEMMHPAWGHIRKNPGQNQFNGHAVDAIMLVVPSGHTAPGIYDIIQDSASPNARPVFNFVEPPAVDLWYYPAAPPANKNRYLRGLSRR
jgi:hypothetical protein